MALPDQEIVLEIKQEPSWQSEYGSNQEGYEMGFKEGEERSSRSPDSQGTENIEMEELDNESATVEDLGEEWCEDETGNLCDPLCHMSSDVLGTPESSDGGDAGSYSSKKILQLSTWMSNMRTYYGKLGNLPNTGYRAADHKLTERELWIKNTFGFLSDHIVRIKRRKGVTLGKHGRSKTDGRTGSQAGSHTSSQAESITSDACEDDLPVMHAEATVVDTEPGTSTGGATPQGKGDRPGMMPGTATETSLMKMPPVEKMDPAEKMEQVEKMDPVGKTDTLEKMDIKTIERICARIVEKGPVQPTVAPDSPHSAELNDFARTIVSSMRRIPEERWNDVKTDIMLVVRNYSTSAHTKATPPMPASATQYPMGYWPPAPPAHAPPYNPNAIPGYNYPTAPGHGYYGPPPGPSTGPPLYPPGPPHMHPALQQGPQSMQAGVVAAPISTATTTATNPATTATSSAANTSGS